MKIRERGWLVAHGVGRFLYRNRVVEAFFLGIILSAFFNPILVPPLQDKAEDWGFFGPPDPQISIQYSNSTSIGYMDEQAGVDVADQRYRNFFIEIENPTKYRITELNIAAGFHGCAHTVEIFQTSLDSVFLTRSAKEVDTGFLMNDSCIGTITVEELPPNHVVEVFVVTDLEQENKNYPEGGRLKPFGARIYYNYEWTYNGRTYFEHGENESKVTDRMTAGELFR